jgi:hypothetical protein
MPSKGLSIHNAIEIGVENMMRKTLKQNKSPLSGRR